MNIYNYTYNNLKENYFTHKHPILGFFNIFNREIGCTGIPAIRRKNESSIPSNWKYLDNYFVQKGIKAGKFAVEGCLWGGRKCIKLAGGTIVELFFAKRRMEFLKKSFDFFQPCFWDTTGGKIRAACLLALVICSAFQSYLLFFTNNINKKFYALSGQETITSEDLQEAFRHFAYWTGLQLGLTFFQTITQEWLKNSLLKEVRCKYLEELKLNNSFYGLDLLQEKNTNDGDNENLTNKLTQSLSQVESSVSSALSIIQIIPFRLSNLYGLLFNQGTLLVAALMYGLTIKPLQDFVVKQLIDGNKKEELKLNEQLTGKMNQLFFCSESIALRSGGIFEIDGIKEICSKSFKNKNWQLCFEIYRSSLSSAQDVLTTFFAMYLLADQVVSKTISMDEFMLTRYQLSSVISSMNEDHYLMDSYIHLEQAFKNLDHASQKIKAWNTLMKQRKLTIHHGNTVKFKGKIELPLECGNKFKTIVEVTNPVIFQKGKWYRIKGKSGSGKTTIFRAFSGLWPYVSGRLEIPQATEFLPQKPFVPALSAKLIDIIRFPEMKHLSSTEEKEIKKMMEFLGLEMELNEEQNWDRILSGGQKQKIALISALIKKPKCLILDEPTAAMDKHDQFKVHSLIRKKLPDAIIIYTDHHPLEGSGNETVYEITEAKKLLRLVK